LVVVQVLPLESRVIVEEPSCVVVKDCPLWVRVTNELPSFVVVDWPAPVTGITRGEFGFSLSPAKTGKACANATARRRRIFTVNNLPEGEETTNGVWICEASWMGSIEDSLAGCGAVYFAAV
jgi:hypothetical protein